MTADRTAAKTSDVVVRPSVLPAGVRTRILIYLGVLLVLLGFGSPAGGLIGLPISFLLKNKLHLQAHEMAIFALVAGAPAYVSFLFGFARDIWNPFGMGDRGFMVLFGGLCAVLYVTFAFVPVNYQSLLIANLLLGTAFLLVSSAQNGLTSTLGQQHVMSGQVSTAWNIFGSLPGIAALILGGSLSDLMESREAERAAHLLFIVGAAMMALVALFGLWRLRQPASRAPVRRPSGQRHQAAGQALADLPRPADLVSVELCAGLRNAVAVLFAGRSACRGFPVGSVECDLRCFLHSHFPCLRRSMSEVLAKAAAVLGHGSRNPAVCPAAVHPLREWRPDRGGAHRPDGRHRHGRLPGPDDPCPGGLQGTLLMMSAALYAIVAGLGNLLGTNLYDHFGGFTVCVIAITAVYALILPVLLLVPKRLIDTADGQIPVLPFTTD